MEVEMFGWFKKKYPVLTSEMITPTDKLLTTTDAKQAFKQFMKTTGYLDKEELSEHASYLSDEIKDYEQSLKEDYSDKKEEISEIKKRLKDLKKKLSGKSTTDKEELEIEVEEAEDELKWATDELEEAAKELDDFKKDKRTFIIDYVNTEVHGHDWKEKFNIKST